MNNKKEIRIPLIIGGFILIITFGLGLGFMVALSKDTSTLSKPAVSNPLSYVSTPTTKYKDGSYTAIGKYNADGGPESISVTLQIQNDKISNVSVVSLATNRQSTKYNNFFISGISGVVVGKSIDTKFSPRVVNGASLTIKGFDNALETIRTEAKI